MKFKVGDICITQNTLYPLLNDGLRVEIVAINPDLFDRNGESVPYSIKRVNGEACVYTVNISTGVRSWFTYDVICCAEYKLRKASPPEEEPEEFLSLSILADVSA